jgi:hypothetical protein
MRTFQRNESDLRAGALPSATAHKVQRGAAQDHLHDQACMLRLCSMPEYSMLLQPVLHACKPMHSLGVGLP